MSPLPLPIIDPLYPIPTYPQAFTAIFSMGYTYKSFGDAFFYVEIDLCKLYSIHESGGLRTGKSAWFHTSAKCKEKKEPYK